MSSAAYAESIDLLEGLYRRPVVPARRVGLRRTHSLLNLLDNPHTTFRSVHVTGSSGKGSTTTMIGAVLAAHGFRTGLFRSPHLVHYRERIAVNGDDISEADWVRCFGEVWPFVEQLSRNDAPNYIYGRPSLIEVLFAMSCVHFRYKGVAWAAVETGLGGRLDPTNTLAPDVAVITNVSLEHTQILGSTIAAIAQEKAAIIKPGGSAVTAAAEEDAIQVIETRAARVGVPLTVVGRDVRAQTLESYLEGQLLSVEDAATSLEIWLPLAGRFQARNAATAVAAVRALQARGVPIRDSSVVDGLRAAKAPGRLEIHSRHPLVLLDGAHNPAAARELAEALGDLLPGKRVYLVFAAMADKDLDGIARSLSDLAAVVYTSQVPDTDRAADAEVVAQAFRRYGIPVHVTLTPEEALAHARAVANGNDVILVTGSMYLVGWARRAAQTERV